MTESKAQERIQQQDLYKIIELAHDKSEPARSLLASALSDLFSHPLTATETRLVADILLTLVQKAENDLKQSLSERLALFDHVPRELILHLAQDELSVAQFILKKSKVLNDYDLLQLINAKSEEYWHVIAQRDSMGAVVVDSLINTGHINTLLALLDNKAIVLQQHSIKNIIRFGVLFECLHEPVLKRQELNTELASYLYMFVSNKIREDIRHRFGIDGFQAERALDFLDQEMQSSIKGRHEITEDLLILASRFHERKQITADLLIKSLRRGQYGFFVALLSVWAEIDKKYIREIIVQEGGKAFAILMRYLGVQKSEFAPIFLLSRGIRDQNVTIHNDELIKALATYESLDAHEISKVIERLIKK